MFQLLITQDKQKKEQKAIVELYCTASCPYCRLVRNYFKAKGINYLEFRVDLDKVTWLEMEYRSQRVTVPQIFIDGYHVGGYEDLLEMDKSKRLEQLL